MTVVQLIIIILSLIKLFINHFFHQPAQLFAYTPPPPPPLPSSQIIFEDDFSQGLEKWQLARGSLDSWSITTNSKLEAFLPDSFQLTELVIKDQYWQDQWQDIVIAFEYQALTDADLNWGWAYRDPSNWTEYHLYGDKIRYTNLQNNKAVFKAWIYYQYPRGEPHQVIISIDQGKTFAWVDGQMIMGFTDQYLPLASGKPFLKVTTGAAYPTHVRFDNYKVYLIGDLLPDEDEPDGELELSLPLTEFKQYQEPWSNQEYDHALSWKKWGDWRANHPTHPPQQVTINHWGCALSSLAMVMRYHQLNKLPDGADLNPGSLNNWLSRQADGYVGEGALNWLAGTRLSRLISQQYSTANNQLPVLEYSRVYSDLSSSLYSILSEHRPAILQIPGHFLVSNGYFFPENTQQPEYLISDPAYSYSQLSTHQKPLVSLVDLQPSYTDLSYLMAVYPANLEVLFLDEQDELIQNTSYSQDSLANPIYADDDCEYLLDDPDYPYPCVSHHSLPTVQALAKAETGVYQLQVSGGQSEINHLKLYLYDRQADVKLIDWYDYGTAENDSTTLRIYFDKESVKNSVVITDDQDTDYEQFFIDLGRLLTQEELSCWLRFQLAEIIGFAFENKADLEALFRYRQLALQLLSVHQN